MTSVVAMNGTTNSGGSKKISLRLQCYGVLVGVSVVVVLAFIKYMPVAAAAAVGYNFWGVGRGYGASADNSDSGSSSIGGNSSGGDAKNVGRTPVVIFNFGDSNSDTGGMAAAVGMHITLPEGRTYFRRPTGRLSDGRLIIDFICESLNTPHLSPYLKALGADFRNGVNFAIGGSTATPGGSSFSLDVQLHQFLFFRERSLELISLGMKAPIDREGFENAVYTIDIGQNDVSAYLHLPYDQVLAKLPAVVAQIKYVIQVLYDHRARKFWIHGTGALGCLPQKLAIPRDDDSDLDENGCLKTYNNAAKALNTLLSEACDQLRLRMVDATIVYTDIFSIKYDLVANHTKYGIEKPLMTCCGYGGPPYNYDHFKACMSAYMHLCDIDAKFISWDGVHYTEVGNSLVASKVLSGEFSKPRIKLATLFNSTKNKDV